MSTFMALYTIYIGSRTTSASTPTLRARVSCVPLSEIILLATSLVTAALLRARYAGHSSMRRGFQKRSPFPFSNNLPTGWFVHRKPQAVQVLKESTFVLSSVVIVEMNFYNSQLWLTSPFTQVSIPLFPCRLSVSVPPSSKSFPEFA